MTLVKGNRPESRSVLSQVKEFRVYGRVSHIKDGFRVIEWCVLQRYILKHASKINLTGFTGTGKRMEMWGLVDSNNIRKELT